MTDSTQLASVLSNQRESCPICGGSGKIGASKSLHGDPIVQDECPTCSGSGEIFDSRILDPRVIYNPQNSGKSTFLRGVDQERERCAKIARETALGNHDSWDAACELIADKIESGE